MPLVQLPPKPPDCPVDVWQHLIEVIISRHTAGYQEELSEVWCSSNGNWRATINNTVTGAPSRWYYSNVRQRWKRSK